MRVGRDARKDNVVNIAVLVPPHFRLKFKRSMARRLPRAILGPKFQAAILQTFKDAHS